MSFKQLLALLHSHWTKHEGPTKPKSHSHVSGATHRPCTHDVHTGTQAVDAIELEIENVEGIRKDRLLIFSNLKRESVDIKAYG